MSDVKRGAAAIESVVRDTGRIERWDFRVGRLLLRRFAQQAHVMVFGSQLDATGEHFLPTAIVPFPRGFAFGHDGRFFLASGIGPNGVGDNAIVAFDPGERALPVQPVSDPELSPLDLAIGPNGNIVVSSEHPFGALDAVTSVREYDARSGRLVRIFSAVGLAEFRRPRGLRFGPRGHLYCVAQDEVVSFDTDRGKCLGTQARFPRLHGQAIEFFP